MQVMTDPYKKQEDFTPHMAYLEKGYVIEETEKETFLAPDKALCSMCNHEFDVVTTKGEKTAEGQFRIIAFAGNPDAACPKQLEKVIESNE